MQEDDEDIEEWAQQLRGTDSSKHTPAQMSALRSAIAGSDSAESGVAASDRVGHARLIKHLQKEGLLSDAPAGPPPVQAPLIDTPADTHFMRRLGEPGLPSTDTPGSAPRPRWHAWVGAMAAVLLVAIGLRFALLPEPIDRGFVGSVTIPGEQSELTLAEAASQLESLGFKPRRVSEDGRVLLEVDVSNDQLEAFYRWAEPLGGRPVVEGTYRVFIQSQAPRP